MMKHGTALFINSINKILIVEMSSEFDKIDIRILI